MIRRLAAPPVLVVILTALAVAMGRYLPLVRWIEPPATAWGAVPVLGGMALCGVAGGRFVRERTNLWPFDDPGRLVAAGPFAHSRNPMYLGFLVFLVGVSVLVGTAGALIAPVAFFLAAQCWYIPFEEERMIAVFGPAYTDYARQVRRWV